MDIIKLFNTRYAAKEFDSSNEITAGHIEMLKTMLQLAASSTNAQPWHFTIATTDEGKKRIAKSTQGAYAFNESKILDASATVVFSSKIDVDNEHIMHVLTKEDDDGRFRTKESKDRQFATRTFFRDKHKLDLKDAQHWAEKQVYLNVGSFILGVASLGLDCVVMEGFDVKELDEELGLRERGFSSCLIVPVGYAKADDFNKNLPKSRLDKTEIIDSI